MKPSFKAKRKRPKTLIIKSNGQVNVILSGCGPSGFSHVTFPNSKIEKAK